MSSRADSASASPESSDDRVILAACGAIVPETLAAADAARRGGRRRGDRALPLVPRSPLSRLAGTPGSTAPRRRRSARRTSSGSLTPDERGLPVVTVIDGASHALAFVGSALGVRSVPLGVDRFGQTGSQPEVYAEYGIDAASIATAALVALEP